MANSINSGARAALTSMISVLSTFCGLFLHSYNRINDKNGNKREGERECEVFFLGGGGVMDRQRGRWIGKDLN